MHIMYLKVPTLYICTTLHSPQVSNFNTKTKREKRMHTYICSGVMPSNSIIYVCLCRPWSQPYTGLIEWSQSRATILFLSTFLAYNMSTCWYCCWGNIHECGLFVYHAWDVRWGEFLLYFFYTCTLYLCLLICKCTPWEIIIRYVLFFVETVFIVQQCL